jgi:hypothetical protein
MNDSEASPALRQEVSDQVLSCAVIGGEFLARQAAQDFVSESFIGDGGHRFRFTDFWEVNLHEYTYRFIWCCYAMVWGIRKYDEARANAQGETQ